MPGTMASAEDDYEWQPPTEAEMKILQAKRERSNRISKLMGDYLLKGYKMLGTSCPDCGTIFLQDKHKKNYCVSCSELSADNVKDDPALNQEAARRQVAEEQQRQSMITPMDESPDGPTDPPLPPPPAVANPSLNGNPVADPGLGRRNQTRGTRRTISECSQPQQPGTHLGMPSSYSNHSMPNSISSPSVGNMTGDMRGSVASLSTMTGRQDVGESLATVTSKLTWATGELQRSTSVEASIQLCQLVKACADALSSLHTIHTKD